MWQTANTANAIADCCFHKIAKLQVAALKFLLGNRKTEDEGDGSDSESDDDEDGKTIKQVRNVR